MTLGQKGQTEKLLTCPVLQPDSFIPLSAYPSFILPGFSSPLALLSTQSVGSPQV